MADYYLVGSSGNWQGGSIWATSSGGAAGIHTPLSTDNVHFDLHSTGTVTVGTASACADMTIVAGGAFTITMGATAVLTVSGSLSDDGTGTWLPNIASTLTFNGTGAKSMAFRSAFVPGLINFTGAAGVYTLTRGFSAANTVMSTNPDLILDGSSYITTTGNGGTEWGFTTGNLTVVAATQIKTTVNGVVSINIASGKTFDQVAGSIISGASGVTLINAGTMTIRRVSIATILTITGGTTGTLTFPAGASLSRTSMTITGPTGTGSIRFGGTPAVTSTLFTVGSGFIPNLEGT